MKYFLFEKCLEDEIKSFIEFINENQEEEINIILDTNGGKSAYASIIIKIINDSPQRFMITGNVIYSSAFVIFTKAKCAKFLIRDAIGAFHRARFQNIDILTTGKPVWDSDISKLSNKELSADYISLDFMTKTELRKYKRGDDVFFNFTRLKQIFPEAKIID